ncbi:MAG: SIS domain-containing protein [bacterium]|nr:SIS domain-containing protein [bacterium]
MHDSIKNFPEQFEYSPVIENSKKLKRFSKFVLVGMGGSHLAGDLLKIWNPKLEVLIHSNYGLPENLKKNKKDILIILSSYSGNTEEVLDAFRLASRNKLEMAIIASGGKLLEAARKYKKPYIQLPNTGIQPRMATGFGFRALLKLMGENRGLSESALLAKSLKSFEAGRYGKALARKLKGQVPIIYSSYKNFSIAKNWKIKFNETAKIPAFCNFFPELNHNEMTGFDLKDSTRPLSQRFYFLFLKDPDDSKQMIKRMNITERLYRERGLPTEVVILNGKSSLAKIFSSLLLADWTAYYLAEEYGVDSEQVPMVEEFKRLIKSLL